MTVVAILIAESPSAPMTPVPSVRAVPGRGLEGDRYFLNLGTFSPTPQKPDFELTLIEQEQIEAFATGQAKHLIGKPGMIGFGLDWSHCARMAFVGRTYSYETYYQAVRRCWRFGQKRRVHAHLIVAEGEAEIGRVIDRKANGHAEMKQAMRAAMKRNMGTKTTVKAAYNPTHKGRAPSWLSAV